ncbi:type I-C CRISPR-associated protein Cas5c [Nonomuraea sp. NPDC051941]|uniref:type I-C CRISPR-associated protein Cas5c n=1 Tax=Nonomuraea sp. NPDC051941 TaxID=3364373 RepID=UPI0037C7692B
MSKPARESYPALVMEVRGDFACFTRPELKAERVSYPVMTPSAARGVLQAIFWKPEFDYRIEQIDVLNEIKWFSIRRNEVTDAPSLSTVLKEGRRYHFRAPDKRDQRNTVALRDVAYRIHAQIELKPHATAHVAKYRDQFHRRVERGACFTHPYLGTREFSCTDFSTPDYSNQPIKRSEDLGVMLLRIDYDTPAPRSLWFTAQLHQGVLKVPREGIHDPARDAEIDTAERRRA